jgi:hypothetical protein
MDNLNKTDRHYRVVRYSPEFGSGETQDVLGSHLTMEEAEKLAKENPPVVSDEEIAIEDETATDRISTIETDRI